jgi:hypothetical protein
VVIDVPVTHPVRGFIVLQGYRNGNRCCKHFLFDESLVHHFVFSLLGSQAGRLPGRLKAD